MASRVAAIEKWTAVADICRCLHNFNGVLQICAAFTNAAVYRLKKTWDKVPKTVSGCFWGFIIDVCPGIELQGLLYADQTNDYQTASCHLFRWSFPGNA